MTRRHGIAVGAAIGVLVLATSFAVDPLSVALDRRLEPPSVAHWLGTDELGRDVLARVLVGGRWSIAVAALVAAAAIAVGSLLGGGASWVGGRVDAAMVRLGDLVLAFPGILVALILAAALGPGRLNLIAALLATAWIGPARAARAEVRRMAGEGFVEAATLAGACRHAIFRVHLLPGLIPIGVAQAPALFAGAILAEGALSFLGLGLAPPNPSWGGMIDAGRAHLLDAPWLTAAPAGAYLATVLLVGSSGRARRRTSAPWSHPKSRTSRPTE